MKAILKLVTLASSISLMCHSAAYAEVTLKLAHAAPETDIQQNMSLFFKKEIEARTKGEIKINIYPHGQLGNDAQMLDGTRTGIIDFSMMGLNNYSGLLPESAALTLPFMFPSREAAFKVLDGKIGSAVLTDMEKFGLKGLGYPENGYRNITNNKNPIKTPADLKGLQMRVNNSKALNDMFALLGANPQQIPVAELYTALETGVVDSQDHPISIVLSFKFNEVQKYLSLTQHSYSALAFTMNKNKFDGLSKDQQAVILQVAKEAVDMQRKLSIASENDMISKLEASGMKVNKDVDYAAFQAVTKPIWEAFIKQYGDKMIKEIEAEIK